MLASYGERKIHDILTFAGLNFKEEYSFPDLVGETGRALRFDFAVFDDEGEIDFLIEYQGEQHYKAKPKFGGWAGLRRQQFYDMKKREYCKAHGYKLIAIPYTDEGRMNYDYIMKKAGYGD